MGLAMSGLTHCEKCGQPLGMHRSGMCESCEKEQKQRKEKINMKKEYKRMGINKSYSRWRDKRHKNKVD